MHTLMCCSEYVDLVNLLFIYKGNVIINGIVANIVVSNEALSRRKFFNITHHCVIEVVTRRKYSGSDIDTAK